MKRNKEKAYRKARWYSNMMPMMMYVHVRPAEDRSRSRCRFRSALAKTSGTKPNKQRTVARNRTPSARSLNSHSRRNTLHDPAARFARYVTVVQYCMENGCIAYRRRRRCCCWTPISTFARSALMMVMMIPSRWAPAQHGKTIKRRGAETEKKKKRRLIELTSNQRGQPSKRTAVDNVRASARKC